MNQFEFENKVAVITGGASGIGRAIATYFVDRGGTAIIVDVNQDDGRQLAQEFCKKRKHSGAFFYGDVADRAMVAKVIEQIIHQYLKIDYLFCSAGIGLNSLVADTNFEHWDKLIKINLYGVINFVQLVYPMMVQAGAGSVIIIGSSLSILPFPMHGVYATTKHAVLGLSNVLRIEGKSHNIKVSCVCPGFVDTPHQKNLTYININREIRDSLLPKPMSAEECVRQMFEGIRRNDPIIVIPFSHKILWLFYRIFPRFFINFISPFILRESMKSYITK